MSFKNVCIERVRGVRRAEYLSAIDYDMVSYREHKFRANTEKIKAHAKLVLKEKSVMLQNTCSIILKGIFKKKTNDSKEIQI